MFSGRNKLSELEKLQLGHRFDSRPYSTGHSKLGGLIYDSLGLIGALTCFTWNILAFVARSSVPYLKTGYEHSCSSLIWLDEQSDDAINWAVNLPLKVKQGMCAAAALAGLGLGIDAHITKQQKLDFTPAQPSKAFMRNLEPRKNFVFYSETPGLLHKADKFWQVRLPEEFANNITDEILQDKNKAVEILSQKLERPVRVFAKHDKYWQDMLLTRKNVGTFVDMVSNMKKYEMEIPDLPPKSGPRSKHAVPSRKGEARWL